MEEEKIEKVDLLHADIQGEELHLLNDLRPALRDKRIGYLVVSTHSDVIHYACAKLLAEVGYRFLAEADLMEDSFCFDGILVACPANVLDIPYVDLGSRRHTPYRNTPYDESDLQKWMKLHGNQKSLPSTTDEAIYRAGLYLAKLHAMSQRIEELEYQKKTLLSELSQIKPFIGKQAARFAAFLKGKVRKMPSKR